jgi:hypothetical protein
LGIVSLGVAVFAREGAVSALYAAFLQPKHEVSIVDRAVHRQIRTVAA